MSDTRPEAEAILRRLAKAGEGAFEIAEGALALAALDRPRVPLERYRAHLDQLAADLRSAAEGAADLEARIAALAETIYLRHGYAGDDKTYDDLQNANLMRVVDRRKGLPVALAILCLHAGRAAGWDMAGLSFPGHFLIRLDHEGERAILDPFHGCLRQSPGELRAMLKAMAGDGAELRPEHYAAVGDCDVLLRLQNNIKLRRLQAGDTAAALETLEHMLIFAPDRAELWWEAAALHANQGNLRAAILAARQVGELSPDAETRYRAARLVQQLRARLN
jgi:regulator of sirC expression with transglutaminase-like and TPR domain